MFIVEFPVCIFAKVKKKILKRFSMMILDPIVNQISVPHGHC